MKRFILSILGIAILAFATAQDIPESLEYTQLYSYLDEMAGDGLIHLNTAVRPYSRKFIAQKLTEIAMQDSLLNKRQRDELHFYLNEFSLERDTVPDNWVEWTNRETFNLSLAQPSFHYITPKKNFKMSIKPILGMDIYASKKGAVIKRWYGAELNFDIAHHLSIWGSLRDNSWNGNLLKSSVFEDFYVNTLGPVKGKQDGALLTYGRNPMYMANRGPYLNNIPGVEYKEASYGGDFSDSKGGISLYSWWGSLSLQRERVQWGDAYHCSNIISTHAPAVPMISLHLNPVWWFEFNYMHAWLVSNELDSTYYYTEKTNATKLTRQYRPMNKYMAANMFTFSPVKHLNLSIGNSIIYSERNPQAAYFIPIAFYKSLDHLLTKGQETENQNSQAFLTVSTRNLKHLHVYGSFFLDEFKLSRLKKSNPENNPVSYLVGFNVTNWPLKNLSLKGEFMRSYILCYNHSVESLTFESNSYYLGHYMGDNAQNIFVELEYKPVRGLDLRLSYTNDTKYNVYNYYRQGSSKLIEQKPFAEKTYMNNTFAFDAVYEVFSGCYAVINLSYNNARGYAPTSEPFASEDRGTTDNGTKLNLTGDELAQYYLDRFCPKYLQGKNITAMVGLSFNF